MHGGWNLDVDLGGSGALPLGERDPRRIGPFPVVGVLGSGATGRVYLGVTAQGRYAAVKQVLPVLAEDEGFLRQFGAELDSLGRLPAGVGAELLDSDREARPPWFATAYIPGLSLAEALRAHGGPLPVGALWVLLREAAAGLAQVHALDLVHRDLKPSSVMLTPGGVALIDFGVARAADPGSPSRAGATAGTPAYMAPEQAAGEGPVTGAADVFALAAVLCYAAIGAPPFGEGAGPDVLHRVVNDGPELGPVRAVDAGLAGVLASCLDKDPQARPSAAQLAELAGEHVPEGEGDAGEAADLWPAAVHDRIALRAGFAATAPAEDAGGAPADPLPAAHEGERRPGRRKKVLLVALPLLIVGGGAALPLLLAPGSGSADSSAPHGTSVSASADPSAPAPRGPSGTSPAPSASLPSSPAPPAARTPADRAGDGTRNPASDGGTPAGTAPATAGTGGGAATPPATAGPPTGQGQLRNSADARCLADTSLIGSHTPTVGTCGAPPGLAVSVSYSWAFQPAPDGTFLLVSQKAGSCLTGGALGGSTTLGACDGSAGQQWRIAASTAAGGTYQNVSTGQCLAAAGKSVASRTCDSTQPAQVWYAS
jgi:hypothetical protein